MDCRQARDKLLRAENPRPKRCGSAELADHLQSCAACSSLARSLRRLERAWRNIPLPATVHQARDAFLQRVADGGWRVVGEYTKASASPATRHPSPATRFLRPARWVAAAVLLVSAGLAVWVILATGKGGNDGDGGDPLANADVVERLIEWNLELAQAPSAEERKRLAQREPELKTALAEAKAELSQEDRELSEDLLENGVWLISHDDPVAEADRFTKVADKLLSRVDRASTKGKEIEASRFTHHLLCIQKFGVDHCMKKADRMGPLNDDQKQHLKKLVFRNQEREDARKSLFDRAPPGFRPKMPHEIEDWRQPPPFGPFPGKGFKGKGKGMGKGR